MTNNWEIIANNNRNGNGVIELTDKKKSVRIKKN